MYYYIIVDIIAKKQVKFIPRFKRTVHKTLRVEEPY